MNHQLSINEMNVAKPANGHIDFFLWQVLWPLGVPVEPAQPASEPPPLEQIEDGRDGGRRSDTCMFELVLHMKQQGSARIKQTWMTAGNQAPTSHPVVEQPGAKLCKTGQDCKNTARICKNLFYHTTVRYVIKSFPPHRFDKGKASIEAAKLFAQVRGLNHQNCQLATSCHKSHVKMKARDPIRKQLLQAIANPSTDLVMLRSIRNQ